MYQEPLALNLKKKSLTKKQVVISSLWFSFESSAYKGRSMGLHKLKGKSDKSRRSHDRAAFIRHHKRSPSGENSSDHWL